MSTDPVSSSVDAPLISICTPTYNGMPYIIETIASVRRQTYTKWEMWICDDMSPDGTADAVEKHLAEIADPRIQLIRSTERTTMAGNWNRSLTYARGEFIKLLPQDDNLQPDCLETQQRLLRENPDIGFVTSGKQVIDPTGRVLFTRIPLAEGKYDWATLGPRTLRAIVNIVGEPAGVMFRKSVLDRCGGYDGSLRYFIDIEILLRFLKVSNAYVTGRPLYQFRVHGKSATGTNSQPALDEYRRLIDCYGDELGFDRQPWLRTYLQLKSRLVVFMREIVFGFVVRR
jgi:glycosyltransferase involved in cell wall biosynthesis